METYFINNQEQFMLQEYDRKILAQNCLMQSAFALRKFLLQKGTIVQKYNMILLQKSRLTVATAHNAFGFGDLNKQNLPCVIFLTHLFALFA